MKSIEANAFHGCKKLRTVVFAEGSTLEKIKGASFSDSGLVKITFPNSLKTLGRGAFSGCKNLEQMSFQAGSRLWSVSSECFKDSGLRKTVIPATLIDIGSSIFEGCSDLQIVQLENGFKGNLSGEKIPEQAQMGPLLETLAGETRVWDLRTCKDVVLQEGLDAIGNYWFYGTAVQSVKCADSVREIGMSAFCACKALRSVVFGANSRLERIGELCFA